MKKLTAFALSIGMAINGTASADERKVGSEEEVLDVLGAYALADFALEICEPNLPMRAVISAKVAKSRIKDAVAVDERLTVDENWEAYWSDYAERLKASLQKSISEGTFTEEAFCVVIEPNLSKWDYLGSAQRPPPRTYDFMPTY